MLELAKAGRVIVSALYINEVDEGIADTVYVRENFNVEGYATHTCSCSQSLAGYVS